MVDSAGNTATTEAKYPKLPIVGFILTVMLFPFLGITLPYAVGIGIVCLAKFLHKSQYKFRYHILYLIAFAAPLLIYCYFIDMKTLLGSINLIVFLIFGLYFIFMTCAGQSIISDILMTCVACLPILSFLWFLAGAEALDNPGQLNILLVSQRLSLAFLPFLTLIILIKRAVAGCSRPEKQVFNSIIRMILIVPILIIPSDRAVIDQQAFLEGLGQTVRTRLDIEAIQTWLKSQPIPQKPEVSSEISTVVIPLDEQPDFVKKLSGNSSIEIYYNWSQQQFYISRGDSILFLFCFYWQFHISSHECKDLEPHAGNLILLTPSSYIWCDYSS